MLVWRLVRAWHDQRLFYDRDNGVAMEMVLMDLAFQVVVHLIWTWVWR